MWFPFVLCQIFSASTATALIQQLQADENDSLLTNDVDFSASGIFIARYSKTLNGNGFAIKNFAADGFIGFCDRCMLVNLKLETWAISKNATGCAFIGETRGATIANVSIQITVISDIAAYFINLNTGISVFENLTLQISTRSAVSGLFKTSFSVLQLFNVSARLAAENLLISGFNLTGVCASCGKVNLVKTYFNQSATYILQNEQLNAVNQARFYCIGQIASFVTIKESLISCSLKISNQFVLTTFYLLTDEDASVVLDASSLYISTSLKNGMDEINGAHGSLVPRSFVMLNSVVHVSAQFKYFGTSPQLADWKDTDASHVSSFAFWETAFDILKISNNCAEENFTVCRLVKTRDAIFPVIPADQNFNAENNSFVCTTPARCDCADPETNFYGEFCARCALCLDAVHSSKVCSVICATTQKHHGRCSEQFGVVTCSSCVPGYEKHSDNLCYPADCTSNSQICGGLGSCSFNQTKNSFNCLCNVGHAGTYCQDCKQAFTLKVNSNICAAQVSAGGDCYEEEGRIVCKSCAGGNALNEITKRCEPPFSSAIIVLIVFVIIILLLFIIFAVMLCCFYAKKRTPKYLQTQQLQDGAWQTARRVPIPSFNDIADQSKFGI